MASVKSDISLQIKNNLNRTATFSILGGTQDPSNGQANAKTIYEWDLTAETFANTNVLTIEASTITNPTVITYEVANQDGAITDLETVVRLLNTLNLGVFNLDGNTIWIIDDINIFGNIEVLVSLSFNINVFVQEAYNYFDPLGKTPLVDFQTRYTSVIQQAVNTIPDFVDFVESQGWSLCYPTNANEISIQRFSAGSFFYVTDIGGVLTTNEATSGTSITQAGLENTLLYTADISIWTTLQEIEFLAPLLIADDGYIFKFIFETTIRTDFLNDGLSNNAWSPIDSTYFVNAENQDILVELKPNTALGFYGSDFPNIFQPLGYEITFRSINGRVELIPDGFGNEGIVFNQMDNVSILRVQDIWGATTGTVFCDFSTLIDNTQGSLDIILSFYDGIPVPQEIELDVGFNTKFAQLLNGYGNFTLGGNSSGTTYPIIKYMNTITDLELAFQRIDFDMSVTENLPDIEQIGLLFALTTKYLLRLDLRNQNIASIGVGRDMGYFNDWFFKLGKQTFLSQYPAMTSGGYGDILASTGNNFVLSGQGYYGYQALIENGFTITTPVGAITSNIFTFTQKEGELLLVRTISALGQSTFEITSATKNTIEVVSTSSFFAIGTEVINFPAPTLGEKNNSIFTADPSLDCTSFYIGTNPPFLSTECMTTFLVGNGVFNAGIDMNTFNVNGLTITLPIYPSTSLGDAYGLFQRDFSGLNGNNVSTGLVISYFRINITQLANTLVQPYGSNALFNVAVNGFTPSIPEISFSFCEFGTSAPDNSFSPDPLGLLLPIGATCQNGIEFFNCTFSYAMPPVIPDIIFNINDNGDTQQALLGASTIQNTTFGTFGSDRIQLRSNFNGTGNSISSLTFQTLPDLQSVQLVNSATAIPPPCSLTFNGVVNLTVIIFQNYNMTNLNLTSALPSVSNLLVNDNNLPSADLDSILIALDNNGLNNGNLDYSNQTGGASPSIGVSGLAYNNLILKGWTVTGNVPI